MSFHFLMQLFETEIDDSEALSTSKLDNLFKDIDAAETKLIFSYVKGNFLKQMVSEAVR